MALLLQRLPKAHARDVRRDLLDASECAAVADLIAEVEDEVEDRWRDTTAAAVAALQATWVARGKLIRRRT